MKLSSALLLLPAVVLGVLFGVERIAHEQTRSELADARETALANQSRATASELKAATLAQQLANREQQHRDELADARRELLAAETELASAHQKLATNSDARTDAATIVTTESNPATPENAFAQQLGRALTGVLDNKAARAKFRAREIAKITRTHAAFFTRLNLSPERQAALTELLADRTLAQARGPLALLQTLGSGATPELSNLVDDETDTELRDFLGEDDYAALNRYEETLPQRQIVDKANKALAASGDPIDPTRQERLIELMHETQTAARAVNSEQIVKTEGNQTTINFDLADMRERQKAQDELLMERVRDEALLNPAQEQALSTQLDQQAHNPFAGAHSISIGGSGGALGGDIQIEMISAPEIITIEE